ncbi:MAG: hypothetical protein V4547_17860 [Bacteroidota bacterium]
MQKGEYLIYKTVKSPAVVNTNLPHKPTAVRWHIFKAGTRVKGKLMPTAEAPKFLLVGGQFVVPLEAIKEIVVQDVTSSADGKTSGKVSAKLEKAVKGGNAKIKYLDAGILGAVLGAAAVYLAEKKQWIKMPEKKNTYIGLAIGAGLAMYVVYRIRNKNVK